MLLSLADYHTQLAQYDSAAHHLPAAECQFRLDRNKGGVARCLTRLSRIADQQGRYAASLAYDMQALDLSDTGNTRRFRTSAQIQLGMSLNMVRSHIRSVYEKLQVNSKAELIKRVRQPE